MSYEEMVQKLIELSSKEEDLSEKEQELFDFIYEKLYDYASDIEYIY